MASVVSPKTGFPRTLAQLLERMKLFQRMRRRLVAGVGAWLFAAWWSMARQRVFFVNPWSLRVRSALSLFVVGLSVACDPLPDCYTNQDCSEGLTCLAGECVRLCADSSVCEDDGECRGVYDEGNQAWLVTPHCEADPVCDCRSASDTCVEVGDVRTCVQVAAACTFRSCESGYECVPTAGSSSCLCSGGSCGPSCNENNQCASGSCEDGRCENEDCRDNDTCDSDFVCVVDVTGRGSCQPEGGSEVGQTCTSSSLCSSGHCTLLDDSTTCQISCEKDSECDDDEKCAPDATYEASGGGTCVSTSVCGENQRPVISGGVVACGSTEDCDTDADCPTPGTCVLGQCTCPAGTCEQSCDGDDDCEAGLVCIDDTCSLAIECASTDDCPENTVCATNPAQWTAGKHCTPQGSVPLGASCASASDCSSGLCIDERCEVECETTADCSTGECSQRSLTNGAFALLCTPESCNCAGDEVCLRDGACAQVQPCLLDPCASGESCVAGVCRVSCGSTTDCNDGQICTLSEPDSAYFCALNECACESDEVCSGGVCVTASACRLDTDCESGFCLDGQCQTTCETEADCDGRECLATVTNAGTHLLCGSFGCGCGADSWCDPLGATPQCYRDLNCNDCDENFGCSPALPGNYFAGDAPLVEACQCEFALACGKPCERDEQCAEGESCSARGTCAVERTCEFNSDCAADEDCVWTQNDVLAANPLATGTCTPNACGCKNGEDACVESELSSACVTLGAECSVLERSCEENYRCDATLGLCVCDSPDECGGGCEESADCAPDRLCQQGRCVTTSCEATEECPEGSICGGPTRNRCVQPGAKADLEVCSNWFECESTYCFANNTCATPCDDAVCGDNLVCQMFEPLEYPNERPICLSQPSNCTEECEPGQFCNNAADAACEPPIQP